VKVASLLSQRGSPRASVNTRTLHMYSSACETGWCRPDCALGLFTDYTIVTVQTKEKENISINTLNGKQINYRKNNTLK
jgi:hypothetical protein